MRRRDLLLLGALLVASTACSPAWPGRRPAPDATVRSYLLALFADDARGYDQAAAPPLTQAQLDGANQYRGFTLLEGPTITGGPTPGHAPAASEYTAVVRARAPSGLDYQFDFTVVLDGRSHRVTGSSSRRSVLEPRPCCTGP